MEEMNVEPLTYARVFKEVDIKKMLKATGIEKDVFELYNPAFKKLTIPSKENGIYVNLPDSLMVSFVDYYLNEMNAKVITSVSDSTFSIEEERIDIITFNRPYQFLPEDIQEVQAQELNYTFLKDAKFTSVPKTISENIKDYVYHIVNTRESLSMIADQYEGLNISQLQKWNNLTNGTHVLPGTVLIVRK